MALCVTWQPWEYPEAMIFVFGQEERACEIREALEVATLARPGFHQKSAT